MSISLWDTWRFFSNILYPSDGDDAFWSNGEKVTANDFVFAMRRAINPKTESPNAQLLYCIKNAKKIHTSNTPVNALGVTALNDLTLKIELQESDPDFLYVLTTAICMPCNEKFFNECAGKYGLFADCIISIENQNRRDDHDPKNYYHR